MKRNNAFQNQTIALSLNSEEMLLAGHTHIASQALSVDS
jgi:hypothetical protein